MSKKIMVVDDEPDIRTYLMAALEDHGYEPCTFRDNEPVIDSILDEEPHLIILDIMMPRRSGVSIYKELRASQALRDIPIIVISGISPAEDFMEEGFKKLLNDPSLPLPEGFVEKPIKVPTLIQLVNKTLSEE